MDREGITMENKTWCHQVEVTPHNLGGFYCTACGNWVNEDGTQVKAEEKPAEEDESTIDETKMQENQFSDQTNPIIDNKAEKQANNPIESHFVPDLKREFELYNIWKNMPPLAKNQSDEVLISNGVPEFMIEVMRIKTQKEFASIYGLNEATLVDWNKKIEENNIDQFSWAKHLSKNMLMALYRSGLKKGSADQIKAWFQIVEGWIPKTESKIEDTRETTLLREELSEILNQITEGNGGIADK